MSEYDPTNVKDVLGKFAKGAPIEHDEEIEILEEYASTGMVTFGFDYKNTKAEARLTDQGRMLLKCL